MIITEPRDKVNSVYVTRRWRKFWYGVEEIVLPNIEDLDPDVIQRCEQFERYHKQRCRQSIVSDQRYVIWKYSLSFERHVSRTVSVNADNEDVCR